jgi:hypothetical protein
MGSLSTQALTLVKTRLNRASGDTSLDTYLAKVIEAAELEIERMGINLQDDADDLMTLVDFAVWRYQNRDQAGERPQWLRYRLKSRWLSMKGRETE